MNCCAFTGRISSISSRKQPPSLGWSRIVFSSPSSVLLRPMLSTRPYERILKYSRSLLIHSGSVSTRTVSRISTANLHTPKSECWNRSQALSLWLGWLTFQVSYQKKFVTVGKEHCLCFRVHDLITISAEKRCNPNAHAVVRRLIEVRI